MSNVDGFECYHMLSHRFVYPICHKIHVKSLNVLRQGWRARLDRVLSARACRACGCVSGGEAGGQARCGLAGRTRNRGKPLLFNVWICVVNYIVSTCKYKYTNYLDPPSAHKNEITIRKRWWNSPRIMGILILPHFSRYLEGLDMFKKIDQRGLHGFPMFSLYFSWKH